MISDMAFIKFFCLQANLNLNHCLCQAQWEQLYYTLIVACILFCWVAFTLVGQFALSNIFCLFTCSWWLAITEYYYYHCVSENQ